MDREEVSQVRKFKWVLRLLRWVPACGRLLRDMEDDERIATMLRRAYGRAAEARTSAPADKRGEPPVDYIVFKQ